MTELRDLRERLAQHIAASTDNCVSLALLKPAAERLLDELDEALRGAAAQVVS